MSEEWVAVNAGAPMFTAQELAAAEERGRRRGVEELNELRKLLRECEEAVRETVEDGSWAFTSLLVRIDAALAPRDSREGGL